MRGRREGGASLLPSNLDSWVYGRKHSEADAVIKAIPEAAAGGRERSPPQGWPPLLSTPLPEAPASDLQQAPRPAVPCSCTPFCSPGNQRRVAAFQGSHSTQGHMPEPPSGVPLCQLWSSPGCRESPDTWLLCSVHPWTPGPIFPESPSPHIPEVSGQNLARAVAGGQSPPRGQDQGSSLGLNTRLPPPSWACPS